MKFWFSVLVFSCCFTAGGQTVFQKYFSEPIEYQKFALSASDNSYVIAGSRWSTGSVYDFCAVKIDGNGNILWSKSYSSPNDEFLSSLSVSVSGEIILSGYKSTAAGDNDLSLMKLDASGTLLWYKTYGTSKMESSDFAGLTQSGDFFISGNRNFGQLPCIIKTNNSGSILWSKTYGTTVSGEEAKAATMTKDGGVIVAGALPAQKIFLTKIKPDGSSAWTNIYTAQHGQLISSLKQTNDNGFVIGSTDYRCDTSGCFAFFSFIKLDSSGNVVFAKAVEGFHGWGRNAAETSDGGYVFTGQLQDTADNDAVLIKTDNNGNFVWAKAYGGVGAGETFFVEQTPDGGFALFGLENSQGFLIKTDANGNSGCNEKSLSLIFSDMNFAMAAPVTIAEMADADSAALPACSEATLAMNDSLICSSLSINEFINQEACIVYPNPSNGTFTILFLLASTGKLEVLDVFGKLICEKIITSKQEPMDLSLPSGIYFYRVHSEKGTSFGKLVIER